MLSRCEIAWCGHIPKASQQPLQHIRLEGIAKSRRESVVAKRLFMFHGTCTDTICIGYIP